MYRPKLDKNVLWNMQKKRKEDIKWLKENFDF